jgi:hypothetical protein
MSYGPDILTGGTVTASISPVGNEASFACDNNEATFWDTGAEACPHWWKYDLGAGVNKVVRKLRILNYNGFGMNAGILYGSNNDSAYGQIYNIACANNGNWQEFTFANSTSYRYYKIIINSVYFANGHTSDIYEIEMMEILSFIQSIMKTKFIPEFIGN